MLTFYTDAQGLYVTKNMDGGDSYGRLSDYAFIAWLRENKLHLPETYNPASFQQKYDLLLVNGQPVRYNKAPYNEPKDFSRDQARPGVMAKGAWNLPNIPQSFGVYPNGDVSNPQHWGEGIRAKRKWYLYPFLFVTDLFQSLDVFFTCFWLAHNPGPIQQWLGKNIYWGFVQGQKNNQDGIPQDVYGDSNVSNDLNLTLSIAQAQYIYPTPISYLNRKFYKAFRPHGIQYAWDVYFKGESEFNEFIKPVIEKF